jgi:ERCC4-related helicase
MATLYLTVIWHLYIEYMLRQYPDRQVVFLTHSAVQVAAQYLRFVSDTSVSAGSILVAHGGKSFKDDSLDHYRVVITTPVFFQNMLGANLLHVHRCSLIVFDEAHLARKDHPYVSLLRRVAKELPEHRPKLLGLTSSPIKGRDLTKAIESLDTLCQLFDGDIITPIEPQSVEDLKAATAMNETIIAEYKKTVSDSAVEDAISEHIKTCINLLLQQEDADNKEHTEVKLEDAHYNSDFYNPDAYLRGGHSAVDANLSHAKQDYRAQLVDDLFLLWPNFESDGQSINLNNPAAIRIIHLASVIESNTQVGAMKAIYRTILESWEILEAISAFGAEASQEDVLRLVSTYSDAFSAYSRYRHLVSEWNKAKVVLKDRVEKSDLLSSGGGGKLNTLQTFLASMDVNSRAVVFVQTKASAMRLSKTLNEKLPKSLSSMYIVGRQSMTLAEQRDVIRKFNEGYFNVLVATSVVEDGLEVQVVDLVLRMDGMTATKSLVQSRGRARGHNSRHVLIVNEADKPQLEMILRREDCMMAAVRFRCDQEAIRREGIDIEQLWREYTNMANESTISSRSFIQLCELCQQSRLPIPVDTYAENGGLMNFTCRLTFEDGSYFEGHGARKKEAKFRAADKAYQIICNHQRLEGTPSIDKTSSSIVPANRNRDLEASSSGASSHPSSSAEWWSVASQSYSTDSSTMKEDPYYSQDAYGDYGTSESASQHGPLPWPASSSPTNFTRQSVPKQFNASTSYQPSLSRSSDSNKDIGGGYARSSNSSAFSGDALRPMRPPGNPLLYLIRSNIHANPSRTDNAVGDLQEACQKATSSSGQTVLPTYIFLGQDPHTGEFIMECSIPGLEGFAGNGRSLQKQAAKREAASDVIRRLSEF